MTRTLAPHVPGRCLALFLGTLALLGPTGLRAAIQFDFERPYYVEEQDVQCKDHALVKEGGVYHLFYIHSFPPDSGNYLRSEKWLGHLTSTDLCHWERQDSILAVTDSSAGAWENSFIWAPKIIVDPQTGAWFLYYTGVDGTVTQQAGLAYSFDLYDWTRWAFNPLYHPGAWALWSPGSWSNCRDPEIFHDLSDDSYYMLNTVSMSDGRGAVSLAASTDLINWTDLGPFFENDSNAVLESVQLLEAGGLYHLFFTEQYVQGTSHISSPTLTGPWTKDDLTIIDLGNAPEISDLDGEIVFSRHNAISTPEGGIYYFRFDHIDLTAPGGVPQVVPYKQDLGNDWSVVFGSAFDNQPTWGDNPHYRGDAASNMEGNSYLATFENFPEPVSGQEGSSQGYLPVGLIRSTPFTITENRVGMMAGGGDDIVHLFVGLVRAADERMLFMETGTGGHDMVLRLWDCDSLIGEQVFLVVADLSFTAGGYISTDDIREYTMTGSDPVTPAQPMVDGPLLADVLADAGFDLTATPDAPEQPQAGAGRLLAPHPNPFNPHTRLRYELSRGGHAELDILDAAGRRLRRLFAGDLSAGPGFFQWRGRDDAGHALPSGVYFARLKLDGHHLDSQKLHLIR